MTKNIWIGIFSLLMIAALMVGFNFYKRVQQPNVGNSFSAIPQNAVFILHENNFNKLYATLTSTNIIWKELVTHTDAIKEANDQLHVLDSLMDAKEFREIVENKAITASLHPLGANDFSGIFYFPISNTIDQGELVDRIESTTKKALSMREFQGVELYSIPIKEEQKISFIYHKQLFVLSYSTLLMEDVIEQMHSDSSLLDDSSFSKILGTSGKSAEGNLFVNNRLLPKFLKLYLNDKGYKNLSNVHSYASWSGLDLGIKPNSLMLNGFTLFSEMEQHFLSFFKGQKPQEVEMPRVIPENTAFFHHYGFTDTKAFFQRRKKKKYYLEQEKLLDTYMSQYGVDLEEELLNNIGRELALVITEPLKKGLRYNTFLTFHSSQIDKTKKDLGSISVKMGLGEDANHSYKGFEINRLDISDAFGLLIPSPPIKTSLPYYTIVEDFVVFGETQKVLEKWIGNFLRGKTLAEEENYKVFSTNLSSQSNIFVYVNIARSVGLFEEIVKKELTEQIEKKTDLLRKFEAVAFQVLAEKEELFYNNIFFNHNPVYKEHPGTLWEMELDAPVSLAPQLVVNHVTNTKEIVVQDTTNRLYLVNSLGEVVWKKDLGEPISGKVHQIDRYKNGKLQLLFNTPSKIYLLDRNGKNVESFPIDLPTRATSNVAVFDYDNTKKYRLLIGCEDNKVYNYNVEGKKVEGWQFTASESPAISDIWHIAFRGKDYIIFCLQDGEIKALERSGKERFKIQSRLPKGVENIYLHKGANLAKTYITARNDSGVVYKIYLSDEKEYVPFGLPQNVSYYGLFDVNMDNSKDYVFTTENTLHAFNQNKEVLFHVDFDRDITVSPRLFKKRYIGLTAGNGIYLLDETGTVKKGFPVDGSTAFCVEDINHDNTINLIVGSGNKLYTYNLK